MNSMLIIFLLKWPGFGYRQLFTFGVKGNNMSNKWTSIRKNFQNLVPKISYLPETVSLISGNKFWLVSDRGGSFCWPWQELNYQWSIFLVRFYDFHDSEYFKPAIHQNWQFKLKIGVSIPKRDERQTRLNYRLGFDGLLVSAVWFWYALTQAL